MKSEITAASVGRSATTYSLGRSGSSSGRKTVVTPSKSNRAPVDRAVERVPRRRVLVRRGTARDPRRRRDRTGTCNPVCRRRRAEAERSIGGHFVAVQTADRLYVIAATRRISSGTERADGRARPLEAATAAAAARGGQVVGMCRNSSRARCAGRTHHDDECFRAVPDTRAPGRAGTVIAYR